MGSTAGPAAVLARQRLLHPFNISPRGPITWSTMTVSEARREYHEFMSRMDVAYAFGHGCSIDGAHPRLRSLRAEADRLLARLRTVEAAAGERPLNPPGHTVEIEFSPQ